MPPKQDTEGAISKYLARQLIIVIQIYRHQLFIKTCMVCVHVVDNVNTFCSKRSPIGNELVEKKIPPSHSSLGGSNYCFYWWVKLVISCICNTCNLPGSKSN